MEYPVRIAAKSRGILSTPTVCGNNNSRGISPKARDGLNYAVERGETKSHTYPTVGTRNMGGCSSSFSKLKHLVKIGRLPPEDARAMAGGMKAEDGARIENHGMLNPDWVEWLMFWPIGWTDLDTPNHRLVWYHPMFDPADVTCEASAALPFIPRLTTRRKHRVARVKEIGNGQYPPTAFIAQEWGFALLQSFERSAI